MNDGDFLGLIDDHDSTLQVLYEAKEDHYWIEIPDPEAAGSYGRHVSFDELVELFKTLPDRFDPATIEGLTFDPWQKPKPHAWWQFWK